jgi:copper transport protein
MLSGLTGWVLFAGLLLTTGPVFTRWLILPRVSTRGEVGDRLRTDAATLGTAGAAVLILGLALFLVRQLIEFRDPFSPWGEEASLLLSTPWGRTSTRASLASLLLLGSFGVARRHSLGWWVATPVALGIGAFPALTGHAAAADRFPALFILADTAHVWGAGAWIGGLATVLWLEQSSRPHARGSSLLPTLVPAFSPVAIAAVGTVIVTGAFASWAHLPSVGALFTMTWGRLLLAKIVAAAVVLAFGARNFRILTPRLGIDAGNDAMRRSALVELAVAQLILVATALLVRTSPMGG